MISTLPVVLVFTGLPCAAGHIHATIVVEDMWTMAAREYANAGATPYMAIVALGDLAQIWRRFQERNAK